MSARGVVQRGYLSPNPYEEWCASSGIVSVGDGTAVMLSGNASRLARFWIEP